MVSLYDGKRKQKKGEMHMFDIVSGWHVYIRDIRGITQHCLYNKSTILGTIVKNYEQNHEKEKKIDIYNSVPPNSHAYEPSCHYYTS